jgi:hypothetical protein
MTKLVKMDVSNPLIFLKGLCGERTPLPCEPPVEGFFRRSEFSFLANIPYQVWLAGARTEINFGNITVGRRLLRVLSLSLSLSHTHTHASTHSLTLLDNLSRTAFHCLDFNLFY